MNKDVPTTQKSKPEEELSEDIIVVGPGQMLSEARQKLSLSLEDIADKLNFKKCLVDNIEQDIFDQKLPATFNRGYLRSYAKLVNIDVEEVLSAYDMLGIAEVQRSEMQSFSNLTEKQAEHSRLMWVSYFIVAILFGLMVLWWLQAPEKNTAEETAPLTSLPATDTEQPATENDLVTQVDNVSKQTADTTLALEADTESVIDEATTALPQSADVIEIPENTNELVVDSAQSVELNTLPVEQKDDEKPRVDAVSTAVFTFSGDCWVNIYDATGERIAWGVKKSGYVMTVSGKAPLKVTLGKPELATIMFNDNPIDMSVFNVGNIAKFTLPLTL